LTRVTLWKIRASLPDAVARGVDGEQEKARDLAMAGSVWRLQIGDALALLGELA
jgi:hypothetical protein